MSGGGRGGGDRDGGPREGSEREFLEAMRDVQPVDEDRRRELRRRARARNAAERSLPGFEVEREAQRLYARREDAPAETLERLRSGDLRPANRLDLHGMTEEAARPRVFAFLRQSRASGLDCVALVHGRGLRSPAGPVLKKALPRWLTQLPLARDVLAFGSAPVGRGGDGVTLVALAPRRR